MNAASSDVLWKRGPFEPTSIELEAIKRLRLLTAVSVLTEIVLPTTEAIFSPRPDRTAVDIEIIWGALTFVLFAATWHRWFGRIWKPASLLFAALIIVSTGILSTRGDSPAPFIFLLVLLPVGGAILPWKTSWHCGMCALCLLSGLAFSTQFDWQNQNHLIISGMPAMIASMMGCHLISVTLTRQRNRINAYLQAVVQSEGKFRKIFETSGSLIAIYSIPDACIVDVNPAWERTFGYSRNEVLGKSLADLALTPTRGDFADWVSSLKIGDAGVAQVPVVFRGRLDNSVHCVYSWTTLELNNRDCVLVVGQDVTARVQAEEELSRNREVLVNQERLKAVGELASGIAHDLNNSLNALRLWIEVLCADRSVTSRHSDSLELISRIVRDASSTIGRLQDFARRRRDRPSESVDLNAIILQSVRIAKSTLEEKNSLLGKSIRVEVDMPSLPHVPGDQSELRQLILNLLLNAQDAMPTGGMIRITGHLEREAIAVRVEDEGHGIAQEHLNRIFDPFFSTKGARGTGLGLSIAYATMARIGGSISAANRVEGGAMFILKFPIAHPKPFRNTQQGSSRIQPLRVMLTDDDADNREAFRTLLESRGHTVISTSSGPEALQKLIQENVLVDVVFCDLGMPFMNGWEVARLVKSLKTPPAFFLVTGWAAEIAADHADRKLVDAVIAKPLDPKTVDRLLADIRLSQLASGERKTEGQ
jgi:PAS domain S-box-containing protein